MQFNIVTITTGLLIALLMTNCKTDEKSGGKSYPETFRTDSIDNYFGELVKDPHREWSMPMLELRKAKQLGVEEVGCT